MSNPLQPELTSKPVVVIGAASMDIIGRLQEPPLTGTSTPAEIRSSFGGVARNVAENLGRLGQPVALLSAVGSDPIGQQLLEYTAQAGVDVSACIRSAEAATGTYLAILDFDGQRQFGLDDMRALSALTPEVIHHNRELLAGAGILFMDANLPQDTMQAVFTIARRHKIPVCADATSSNLADLLTDLIPDLYMVTANAQEATVIIGGQIIVKNRPTAMQAARLLVSRGVEIAVIPLAQMGVCYASSTTVGHISAMKTEILDPTGAGDAMTAAILFGLMNDIPLDDAIRLGVSAASLTLRCPASVVPDLSLEKLYDNMVV